MKQNIGKIGEDAAATFLKLGGYKIIARNYREKFGEIDIVAIDPSGRTTVFFEVKTMRQYSGNQYGKIELAALLPEDQMSSSKIHKFRKICEFFMLNNIKMFHVPARRSWFRHAGVKHNWQMDVLAIEVLGPGAFLTENQEAGGNAKISLFKYDGLKFAIRHYENI